MNRCAHCFEKMARERAPLRTHFQNFAKIGNLAPFQCFHFFVFFHLFSCFRKKKVKTLGNFHRNASVSGGLVGEETQKHGGGSFEVELCVDEFY